MFRQLFATLKAKLRPVKAPKQIEVTLPPTPPNVVKRELHVAPVRPTPEPLFYKATPAARNKRRKERAAVRAFVRALNQARG